MKHRIILSIALALSIAAVSLMKSDAAANAARQRSFAADTGFVTLGPNQILRVTVVGGSNSPLNAGDLADWQANYGSSLSPSACNSDGVCKHVPVSQTTTDPVELRRGEAASVDFTLTPSSSGVRVVVKSSSRDMQVNTLIIDGATGAVLAHKGEGWIELHSAQL